VDAEILEDGDFVAEADYGEVLAEEAGGHRAIVEGIDARDGLPVPAQGVVRHESSGRFGHAPSSARPS
jgi:hypothetical protein